MFNVMVGNRDDHLRNHGFLHSRGGWRLAPAFDINPSPEAAEHALALDDRSHQPDLAVVLETAPFYRVSKSQARENLDQVRGALSSWRLEARRLGLPPDEIDLVGTAFIPHP